MQENVRRRLAPLLLVGAAAGAYVMLGPRLPHDHEVVLDLGPASTRITGLEVSWRLSSSEEEAVTTTWHFAKGTAPARVFAHVKLPDGTWEVVAVVEQAGEPASVRWSGQIILKGTSWGKSDTLKDGPVVLPVREAFR